jgi:UDPglucose--hexose-1-phosphate uridylyltransferase
MPELRRDPVVGRWVIISSERKIRPHELLHGQPPAMPSSGICPFCPGQERLTPKEILAYRHSGSHANGPGWNIRVVPNKFPVLQVEGNLDREGLGLFDRMNGIGAHEIIIETPEHKHALGDLPPQQIENVLRAIRDRINDLKRDTRFRYITVFKNHGAVAGATLEHSHSQLIALPVIPTAAMLELVGCREHYRLKERCLFCDIIRQEQRDGHRMVIDSADFVCMVPFAARYPFEMWILPKHHAKSYEDVNDASLEWLARILSDALRRMDRVLASPAYNMVIRSAPLNERRAQSYHWHLEIVPKLAQTASFEEGTGFHINPVVPEEAAKFLREADV